MVITNILCYWWLLNISQSSCMIPTQCITILHVQKHSIAFFPFKGIGNENLLFICLPSDHVTVKKIFSWKLVPLIFIWKCHRCRLFESQNSRLGRHKWNPVVSDDILKSYEVKWQVSAQEHYYRVTLKQTALSVSEMWSFCYINDVCFNFHVPSTSWCSVMMDIRICLCVFNRSWDPVT